MDAGGDEDNEATSLPSHRRRPNSNGTARLLAEKVDEDLTDLLFGEMSQPPTRER